MNRLTYLGIGVVVLLLAGAAFLGGRFLQQPATETAAAGGGRAANERVMVIDNGAGPVRIRFSEPEILPEAAETGGGLFVRREDDSIFVGTGSIELDVEVDENGPVVNTSYDGPIIEIVVPNTAVIYEDTTAEPIISAEDVEHGEMVVPRTVKEVSSLDALAENTMVRVWGERTGDRIIADVVVYELLR